MTVTNITVPGMIIGYCLLIFPLAIILWLRVKIVKDLLIAVLRMSIQLLFVGFYLQVVFKMNSPWLNALWLLVMVVVADLSVARRCGLRIAPIAAPLLAALVVGLLVPLLIILGAVLKRPQLLDAQYAIPLGGMILGNCLRADVIGLHAFYDSIRKGKKAYLSSLAQGASLSEAVRPYYREACRAALAPTIATIATIGLVALPGMMTGVILGGTNPMVAIRYQILIMLAIFSGSAITVAMAIWMTLGVGFDSYGILNGKIFR